MKNILVFGAGRSSSALIEYLLAEALENNWKITVADQSEELVKEKTKNHPASIPAVLNISSTQEKEQLISSSDLVISLLPPTLHKSIADSALKHKKHFLTASYLTDEIYEMDKAAKSAGTIILMETGLDPGIDHMSALTEIERLNSEGGKLISFKSYTGGLIAPESDDNPWHYKFTWNPRNVILAGQGTVKYKENDKLKLIPYHQLFRRTEKISVDGFGDFEGYANRDSLKYLSLYNLNHIKTFVRGTLRIPPFCRAWDVFVQLGLTSDAYTIENSENLTWKDFLSLFLPEGVGNIKERLSEYLKMTLQSDEMKLIESTGIFSDHLTGMASATPADLLQLLLEKKWKFLPNDKDMIVMQHELEYSKDKSVYKIYSSLVVKGDSHFSAMSKTVGLPLGIAAKLVIQNKIKSRGVCLPTIKEIYEPILIELEKKGIRFKTTTQKIM